jgi:uncharacterized membrane protein YeaQ/YmgE (transglycosylase-associated protein family)
MWNILCWIVAGLVIGAIARLLVPGRQPMGMAMTIVLGIVGALIGGAISYAIWGLPTEPFSNYAWPGYLMSIGGAVVLLLIAGPMMSRSDTRY